MKSSVQVVKGRVEEAAGVLIGNDKLRVKGQSNQAVGQVRKAVEKMVDKALNIAQSSKPS